MSPFHLASYVFIGGGFWLIAAGWRVLYAAQKNGALAASGPYARLRHPQYLGLILIMVGFLLQWPTLATLAMFPILAVVYRRLAVREEREVRDEFGEEWDAYAAATPRFLPRRRPLPAPSLATSDSVVTPARHAGSARSAPPANGGQSSRREQSCTGTTAGTGSG